MDEQKFRERRKGPRIKRKDIIQYKIGNLLFGRVRQGVSRIRDLSEKGMFFTIGFPLILEATLKIKLRLPITEESVELEGRIVACEEMGKKLYGLRVEFVNLSEKQKERLKKFVRMFLTVKKDEKKPSN